MIRAPIQQAPGVGTFAAHLLVVGLLSALLLPLMAARLVILPLAEGLIRATDCVHDALIERLQR